MHAGNGDVEGTMDHEMKFDRKNFYAAICINLTAALNTLPDYDFRTLAVSVREYLRILERECDSGKKYHAD